MYFNGVDWYLTHIVLQQFTILHPVVFFQPSGSHYNQIELRQLTILWIEQSLNFKATWRKQSYPKASNPKSYLQFRYHVQYWDCKILGSNSVSYLSSEASAVGLGYGHFRPAGRIDVAFQWILVIIFVVSCWGICGPQEPKYICTVLKRCCKIIWQDPGRRKDSIGKILISNLVWKTSLKPLKWHTHWDIMFLMDKRSSTTFSHSGATNNIKRRNTSLCLSFLPWVFHLPNSVGVTFRFTALHSWSSWPVGISRRRVITGIFNVHCWTALKTHSSLPNTAMATPYQ